VAGPTLRAYVYSCPERQAVLELTLARWRCTDWGADPVVVRDDAAGLPSTGRIVAAARRMLARAAAEPADYYLFLEDDLLFNLHLRENLEHWPPLRDGWLGVGSLYNPGLAPGDGRRAADCWAERWVGVAAGAFYGAQALVLSRAALEAVLRHWEEPGPYDLKVAAIAERHLGGVVVHAPSLVQHAPVPSTWGGVAHRAVDFDPFFRYRPARPAAAPPGCGVITAAGEDYFVGFRLLAASLGGRAPLTLFDAGLNARQRRFAAGRATVLPLPELLFPRDADSAAWATWNKPLYFLHSPYRRTLWIDADCLVTGDLNPLFDLVERAGPLTVSHASYAAYPGNREGLYAREPCRRFPPHANVNAGVVGLGPDDASRQLLDAWAYLVRKAGRDPGLRGDVAWFDEGALHWALQKLEMPGAWQDRRSWNCAHHLPGTASSGEFFRRLRPHPGDVVVHVGGRPKYWQTWSDRGEFDV
jgi:hypothetical protein